MKDISNEASDRGTRIAATTLEPRLDEILDLAREWARPYSSHNPEHHPLDCPRGDAMCFECANEALALGVLALIGEQPNA